MNFGERPHLHVALFCVGDAILYLDVLTIREWSKQRMATTSRYEITIRGQARTGDVNAGSPVQMDILETGADQTCIAVRSDQAGMIGAIRHLHGLGIVLLSILWVPIEANNGDAPRVSMIEGDKR
jgi:hypothetical protein